jgi:hypothetical protein
MRHFLSPGGLFTTCLGRRQGRSARTSRLAARSIRPPPVAGRLGLLFRVAAYSAVPPPSAADGGSPLPMPEPPRYNFQ